MEMGAASNAQLRGIPAWQCGGVDFSGWVDLQVDLDKMQHD